MYFHGYRGFWPTIVSLRPDEAQSGPYHSENGQEYAVTYAAGINNSRNQVGITRQLSALENGYERVRH